MSDKKATGFVQTGEPIPELDEVFGPTDDAYVMGKIPEVKAKVNLCIDRVKTIRYLCEESIAGLEELKEELTKL